MQQTNDELASRTLAETQCLEISTGRGRRWIGWIAWLLLLLLLAAVLVVLFVQLGSTVAVAAGAVGVMIAGMLIMAKLADGDAERRG